MGGATRPTRRLGLLLVLALSAGLLGLTAPSPADASCVGPALAVGTSVDDTNPNTTATPAQVSRADQLIVSGVWFHSGCADTLTSSGGCRAPAPTDPEAPLTGVTLVLRQGEQTWTLGTADAGNQASRFAVRWQAPIPAGARTGGATLGAAGAELPITITS